MLSASTDLSDNKVQSVTSSVYEHSFSQRQTGQQSTAHRHHRDMREQRLGSTPSREADTNSLSSCAFGRGWVSPA